MRNKLALFAAVSALAFAGCKPEQSELDFNSLTEKAIVSGQIVYDAGVDTTSTDGYQVNHIKPVAQQPVYVEIPYSAFKTGAQGYKRFETQTDSKGRYSIEVPTKPAGIDQVQIRMQEFTAYKAEYLKMENGKPVFETHLYSYSYEPAAFTLKPGSIEFFDETEIRCTPTKVSLDELKESITLTGNIQLAEEAGYRKGVYRPATNMTVEFTAQYDGIQEANSTNLKQFTFGTTTDAQGNYTIKLPLKSYEDGFASLKATVKNTGKEYTHYTAPNSTMALNGYYKGEDILASSQAITNIVEGMGYEMPTMYLKFTPGFNNNLTIPTTPSTWTNNLAGWERYDGFNEYKTVTGKYLFGIEKSFGIGGWSNPMQEAYLTITYPTGSRESKSVYVNTDAEGNFSFDIPVKDATEAITLAYTAINDTKQHTHFLADGSTKVFIGKYNTSITTIKEIGAEWNNMGETYYTFQPTGLSAVELSALQWNKDLAGWKKDKDKETVATLTANVYIPVETAYAEGKYVAANGYIMTITANSVSYAAPVINGKFSVDILTTNVTEEPTITWSSAPIEGIKDYKHFAEYGKDPRILPGQYTRYQWIGENEADRTAWNELGDVYYNFVPQATPDNWTAWFKHIAGWVIRDAQHTTKQHVTGTLKTAQEAGYYDGIYANAANTLVKIIIDGETYVGATNAEGKYSIPVLIAADDENIATSILPYFTANNVDYMHYTKPNKGEKVQIQYTNGFTTGRIDGYTAWYDKGTTYYKSPYETQEGLKLLGWTNVERKEKAGYKEAITIKAKIAKATEKLDGANAKAGWINDLTSRGAKLTIGGDMYFVPVKSGNINLQYNVESIDATPYLNIALIPEGGSIEKTEPFIHYANPADITSRTTIYGYYESADNLTMSNYNVEDKTVTIETSAKMSFVPTTPSNPTGWGLYTWNVDEEP